MCDCPRCPMQLTDNDWWWELADLLREYGRRKYGVELTGLTLHGPQGWEHREPFPVPRYGPPARPAANAPPRRPEWASGPEPKHLSDYQRCYHPAFPGRAWTFTPLQAKAVKVLWEAMGDGTWEVKQQTLLDAAGSTGDRLVDLFKRHPAWGALIVAGEASGHYRLAPLPEADEEAA